jgi:chromosome segregation ATPase
MVCQLVRVHQKLAESSAALRDANSKRAALSTESSAQIEQLSQRLRQAEAKVSEEAKEKLDALAKASAVETAVRFVLPAYGLCRFHLVLTACVVRLQSKAQLASLEARLATAEQSALKERSSASILKQQLSDANTELEMLKATANSRNEAASAASSQVLSLSKQLGDANDELVNLNQRLAETTATLRETQAKLAVVESDSVSRIEVLNQRLAKAEAQAADDSRHKSELAVKLAALETQFGETQSALLRVQAESDAVLEREKSLQSELASLHAALTEARQERDAHRDAASAAANEVQELKERVIVAEEERDAARDKEEEYFRELEERDEQISRIQEGCVCVLSCCFVRQ